MFHAQLEGKLSREQENLEDILTSNTFGAFSYLPAREGLVPFLVRAEGQGCTELKSQLSDSPLWASYRFWPWIEEAGCKGCEPDVLISIESRGTRALIMVESKYRSGKSSEAEEPGQSEKDGVPPNDQLAREWANLASLAQAQQARPFLIYVTADFVHPKGQIAASQADLRNRGRPEGTILWVSWRVLPEVLAESTVPMLVDLGWLMRDRYGLSFFTGQLVSAQRRCNWTFSCPSPIFAWRAGPMGWSLEAEVEPTTPPSAIVWNANTLTWNFGGGR